MEEVKAAIQQLRQQAKENIAPTAQYLQGDDVAVPGVFSATQRPTQFEEAGPPPKPRPPRRARPSSAGPRMQRGSREGSAVGPQGSASNVSQRQPVRTQQALFGGVLETAQAQGQQNQKEQEIDFRKAWRSNVPHWAGKVEDQCAAVRIHNMDSAIAKMERSLLIAKRRSAELQKVRTQPITVQSLTRSVLLV